MERYLLYLELLKKLNKETNVKKRKELINDLNLLKDGFMPIKYIMR